jgi:Uma2 family endonuclease
MATADVQTVIDEPLYEIVNGERVEVPSMGARAGRIANFLAFLLNEFARPRRLGEAMVEILFLMRPDLPQRRPDVAFVSAGRWTDEMNGPDDPPAYAVVPDIAVEVDSPANTAREIENKVQEYFTAGVRLVWVIYPDQRRVHVFDAPTGSRILHSADTLEGTPVLPGFRVPVNDLFSLPSFRRP